ncbi:MAG: MFS transporter [Candidatus Omnitrophota bacterium]|jgi:MFS family permease|nr:MFS transporter [Candidatus Omnitrophota bacterium]
MTRFRDVLKDRNFLCLWIAQIISNFGDRLTQMALVALIYQTAPGSAIALAKLISFTIIPVFLIGPIAGAWVDRLNKRNVMVISDLLRGILVLAIPLFIMLQQILLVYLAVFLVFSLSRFFIPSRMAIIPDIVSKDKLLVANTLADTTHMLGNVMGLVVAGVLVNIRFIGAIGGFYIDAATFFASAALIGMIVQKSFAKEVREDLKVTKEAFSRSIRKSIFVEIKDGIMYFKKYSQMHFIVYVFFLLMAGLGAISCVVIVFIQESFGTATLDLGLIGMFLAGGLLLGTLLYGKLGQGMEKPRTILLSFIGTGISVVLFAFFVRKYPNILVSGLLAGLMGMMASPIMVSVNTMTHETMPEEARGRTFSSLESVIHLAFLIFMFLAAYAAKYIERFWILIIVGIIFIICGFTGMVLRKNERG